jgi:probable F420-dependent oxidoreductase
VREEVTAAPEELPMYGRRPVTGRLGVWAAQFDRQPAAALRRAVTHLEDLGYGTVWLGETLGRDALVTAALLLAGTGRITVATAVVPIYARDPLTLAQAQRTLLEEHADRFVLGVGISHPMLVQELRGLRFGPRVPTMSDYLDRLDAAPAGPPDADRDGPRVIGAVGRRMLELAGRRASGALPFGMPVEHTALARTLLGPEPFLGVVAAVLPRPDGPAAREVARRYVAESLPNRAGMLATLGYPADLDGPDGDRLIGALVAVGGRDAIAARLTEHLDAGADHVALYVIGDPDDELPGARWRALAGLLG